MIEGENEEKEEIKKKKEEEERKQAESEADPGSGSRGTESFTPSDPQSNMIFMWGSPKGDKSQPDDSMFIQFATELGYIYDRTNLSVTFPDILIDMQVETHQPWEIRLSNLLQKCQVFFDYNVVTKFEQSAKAIEQSNEETKEIVQKTSTVSSGRGKPYSVGKVLIIYNDRTEN